jgi:hypothetical protein
MLLRLLLFRIIEGMGIIGREEDVKEGWVDSGIQGLEFEFEWEIGRWEIGRLLFGI